MGGSGRIDGLGEGAGVSMKVAIGTFEGAGLAEGAGTGVGLGRATAIPRLGLSPPPPTVG